VSLFANSAEEDAHAKALRDIQKKRDSLQESITKIEEAFRSRYSPSNRIASTDLVDLEFRFYRDTWDKLPDFNQLKPETKGKLESGLFDISQRTRDDAFGYVFDGVIIVPQEGDYTFYVDSDDGSRLTVDGNLVVYYDGIHGLGSEQEKKLRLRQGRLPIKLEYFQKAGGLGLNIAWSGPGFTRRQLSIPFQPTVEEQKKVVQKDFNELIRKEGLQTLGNEEWERYGRLVKELQELKDNRYKSKTSYTEPVPYIIVLFCYCS
jgi:hypothetical protein